MEKERNSSDCRNDVVKVTWEKINLAITWYVIKVIFIYILSVFPIRMKVP